MVRYRLWLLAPVALMALAPMAMAADATMAQVHDAAAAGHVDQALEMMGPVLKNHPDSAKAHYVEAELLAKAKRLGEARAELAKAESLAPGLPFVKNHSVSELKAQLAGTSRAVPALGTPVAAPASRGFPWTPVIIIGLVLFAVLSFFRRRSAQNTPLAQPGYGQQGYGGQGYGGQGPWGGQPGSGMMGGGMGSGMGSGMGGGILGGLASGAAMGAGFAAGGALVDRLIGGEHPGAGAASQPVASPGWDANVNQDMGGDDFGIADGGGWDDGGSSGGDW